MIVVKACHVISDLVVRCLHSFFLTPCFSSLFTSLMVFLSLFILSIFFFLSIIFSFYLKLPLSVFISFYVSLSHFVSTSFSSLFPSLPFLLSPFCFISISLCPFLHLFLLLFISLYLYSTISTSLCQISTSFYPLFYCSNSIFITVFNTELFF